MNSDAVIAFRDSRPGGLKTLPNFPDIVDGRGYPKNVILPRLRHEQYGEADFLVNHMSHFQHTPSG
jgi:hypothetical protein